MQGTKHLIECHCVLPQYRNIDNPVYHKFVVFSMLGDGGTVVPKFSQCNNCGVIHKIYDLCKSEIAAGKDELRSVVKADELKISIPSQLWDVLTTYDVDVAILENRDIMKKIGKSSTDKKAEEVLKARQIVQEIMNFGVTQQQVLRVTYLLSLELENRNAMINISETIKEYLDDISSESKNDIIV